MSGMKYEIEKLNGFSEIDTGKAMNSFGSRQEYFDRLTEFAENCTGYLKNHSPYKVVTWDENRRQFINELKELRKEFEALGMTEAIADLGYIESTVFNRDSDSMERELDEFYGRMKKISEFIISARTSERNTPKPEAKPIVLAVDDMPALLTSVAKMLQGQYSVMAVTSGKAALKILEKHTPSIFLLDIEMPQMDGYTLADKIRADNKFKTTPIIFLTSKGSRDDVISAIRHGGNDYIVKPVDKGLLLSKIKKFLSLENGA